jgi:rhodanese-related sulfurtransferase
MARVHRLLAIVAAVLGIAAAFGDSNPGYISAPALAERIMRGDETLRVFDLRPLADYNELHIPTAVHTTLEELSRTAFTGNEIIVLYRLRQFDGDAHAGSARSPVRLKSGPRVYLLREGIYEWIARVREPRLATDATPAERAEFERATLFSRFFGGMARTNVARSEVPTGYWTTDVQVVPTESSTTESKVRQALLQVRRRGC